jgi:hypothetical protein
MVTMAPMDSADGDVNPPMVAAASLAKPLEPADRVVASFMPSRAQSRVSEQKVSRRLWMSLVGCVHTSAGGWCGGSWAP